MPTIKFQFTSTVLHSCLCIQHLNDWKEKDHNCLLLQFSIFLGWTWTDGKKFKHLERCHKNIVVCPVFY